MFLKPFKSKNKTAIKGSDRKKLRHDLGRQFSHLNEEDLKSLVPNKEEMSSMKLVTHAGHNMTVYSLGKNPAFFELEHEVFPTVYTLWKFPELLPTFTTWPPVFGKLCGGADLMLPGVVLGGPVDPHTFSHISKGQPCSVKLLGNKAPVAVGRAAMSGSEMYESAMRGKGVNVMHTYKDLLWAIGDKQEPPTLNDSEYVQSLQSQKSEPDDEAIANAGDENDINEKDKDDSANLSGECEGNMEAKADSGNARGNELGELREDLGETESMEGRLGELNVSGGQEEGENGGESLDKSEKPEEEEGDREEQSTAVSTPEQTDALLVHCFLCALKGSVSRKSDLPLLTSSFYRNHMLKFCPHDKSLDVKKSSYKKLGKFLQAMQKQGFIKVKELSKGSDSITEVNKDHTELRGFVVPDLPAQEAPASAADGFVPPDITEMYTVTAAALALFREVDPKISKGDALTVPEIRQMLQTYVKTNNLQKGSSVQLDPGLSSLVLHKGEYLETLRWEELFSRIHDKLSPACRFVLPGQQPVIKKGKLEPITMKLATRAGNKKVTLIHHLEPYGVDLEEFAHTVQLGVACSTSITQLPGKGAGSEVLVQGNQVHFVHQLLIEKYKIPKKYIQGAELAPKSKKKR